MSCRQSPEPCNICIIFVGVSVIGNGLGQDGIGTFKLADHNLRATSIEPFNLAAAQWMEPTIIVVMVLSGVERPDSGTSHLTNAGRLLDWQLFHDRIRRWIEMNQVVEELDCLFERRDNRVMVAQSCPMTSIFNVDVRQMLQMPMTDKNCVAVVAWHWVF